MKNLILLKKRSLTALAAVVAMSSLMLAGCSTAPVSPMGASQARAKLTLLQNDPKLGTQARVEMREADEAVSVAEQALSKSEEDEALGKYRVYLADYKVEIAKAKATARYAEAQRSQLGEERSAARLDARTREADRAHDDADQARSEAADARSAQAETSAQAAGKAAELQRQIDALQARQTERGLVLTLGDVLFTSNSAQLQGGAKSSLDKLVTFLNQYPARKAQIEGHTDSIGSADYNQGLSQHRAESVQQYLLQRGISGQRLSSSGIGESQPLADNNTALGRQQNRRVEIIIDQPRDEAVSQQE